MGHPTDDKINICKVALRQGRFNWRHYQILREIMKTVLSQIEEFNSDTTKESKRSPSIFHKAGNKREKVTLATPTHYETHRYFFSDANDWKIIIYEDERQRNFPQHITEYSYTTKTQCNDLFR